MSRYAKPNSLTLSLLVLLLVDDPSIAQGNEPLIQADVYDALYKAYVQCDDNLDQSRSEFITDKLERDGGHGMSIEWLMPGLSQPNFAEASPPPLAPGMTERVPAPDPAHRHQLRMLRLR